MRLRELLVHRDQRITAHNVAHAEQEAEIVRLRARLTVDDAMVERANEALTAHVRVWLVDDANDQDAESLNDDAMRAALIAAMRQERAP